MTARPTDAAPVARGEIRPDLHAISTQIGDAVRRSPPRAGSTRVIAIDGLSGAGKSSLSQSLSCDLGAPIVHLDELYEGWGGLEEVGTPLREWVIDRLIAGRNPRWQPWDWDSGVRSEHWLQVPRGPYLVIEGCGAGDVTIAASTSFLVWVQAPPTELDDRLQARHDWPWYQPNLRRWRAQEARTHARNDTRARADAIVFNGTGTAVSFATGADGRDHHRGG